ncbi:hypothetical protein [Microcoleus sp. bin38.metabat.b11b12b14.051]|uniref:hypothetical protein n=1 Tax=Microcoleus sp. bin38.metabat.b11b12b14.051 TaxID=2742709 RepID=UPI0025FD9AA0|nr:hypothetical protein [Microcoleus sp. bin38.metabat.b11b12b14.051]
MNLMLWVWGRWSLAIGASILLSPPVMAAPTVIKSQAGSQQQGNPEAVAAERA